MSTRWRRLGRKVVWLRPLWYFLLGVVVLDRLVAMQASRWQALDSVFYRDRLAACRARSWDLVVVGSSPALAGVNAEILAGLDWRGQKLTHAFTMGLALATTREICHAVEHGLTAPPKLLVYAITVTDLNGSRLEPQGPRHLMDRADLARWIRQRPDQGGWVMRHYLKERLCEASALVYHAEGIRRWLAEQADGLCPGLCPEAAAQAREGRLQAEQLRSARGLAPKLAEITTEADSNAYDARKAAGRAPPFTWLDNYDVRGHLPYLDRLLDGAQRKGIPVVLVTMPVVADVERAHARELAEFRELLAEIQSARGVRILQPTLEELDLSDADFADQPHLNARGMTRFSTWLRAALEREGQ